MSFDDHLAFAIELLLGSDYGGIGSGVCFGSSSRTHDDRHWRVVLYEESREGIAGTHVRQSNLLLKSKVAPSLAIDLVFANLDLWAFDCAEVIQVARWYAIRHAMGEKKFNRSASGQPFILRSHFSTGLGNEGVYSRTDVQGYYDPCAGLTFTRYPSFATWPITATAEQVIRGAPIGARVLVTCDDRNAAATPFENQNILKIGRDRYAAHPVGIGTLGLVVHKTTLHLIQDMGLTENGAPPMLAIDAIKKTLYVSEIELIKKAWYSATNVNK